MQKTLIFGQFLFFLDKINNLLSVEFEFIDELVLDFIVNLHIWRESERFTLLDFFYEFVVLHDLLTGALNWCFKEQINILEHAIFEFFELSFGFLLNFCPHIERYFRLIEEHLYQVFNNKKIFLVLLVFLGVTDDVLFVNELLQVPVHNFFIFCFEIVADFF